MSMSSNDLSHELVVLTDVFTDLSERLMEAAQQLQTPGLPPPRRADGGAVVVPARVYQPPRPDTHAGPVLARRLSAGRTPGKPGGPDHIPQRDRRGRAPAGEERGNAAPKPLGARSGARADTRVRRRILSVARLPGNGASAPRRRSPRVPGTRCRPRPNRWPRASTRWLIS